MSYSRATNRGQSSVIGVVLVVAITVIGISVVVLTGVSGLESAKQQADSRGAEQAMTQLDSQASLVGLGSSTSNRVIFPKGEAELGADSDAGWINVSVVNSTTNDVETVIVNATMGAVYYRSDDATIAYQGGGVWKMQNGGSVMVSPPEFHYRTTVAGAPTLTLPLVTVEGDNSLSKRIMVQKSSSPTQHFPNDTDPAKSNPLADGEIEVTVHSEYYEAWGAFFKERTTANVTYFHSNETVEISLIIPFDGNYNEIVATSQPNGISVHGNNGIPEPYRMGADFPTADSLIEAEVQECETNASACNDPPGGTLTSGTYYYDSGQSGDLDIDTTGGEVSIVVNGEFAPGAIDISGSNSVTVYVKGDFTVDSNDPINEGGSADTLSVLVHSDGDVDMNGKYTFVGFVYAPGSEIDLNGGGGPSHQNVKGGIIGDQIDVNGNPNKFQYDDSISDIDLALEGDVAKITYLHVSTNPINVTST